MDHLLKVVIRRTHAPGNSAPNARPAVCTHCNHGPDVLLLFSSPQVTGQSWRVKLDYGLETAEANEHEAILVCAPAAALQRLAVEATGQSVEAAASSDVLVLSFAGFNEDGTATAALESWRQLAPSASPMWAAAAL